MAGVFDTYSDACFGTLENLFGEGIVFISSSDNDSYKQLSAFGIVDNITPRIDDYGNVVFEENKRITVANSDDVNLVEIGDSISIDETSEVYKIINIMLDVNSSKVFYLG